MKSTTLLHVPLLWGLFSHAAMAQMPYNPTRILQNGTRLYVYRPAPSSSAQFELGSIDLSSKVAASAIPFTTLYPTLPFLGSSASRAFTPTLGHGGNMTVYTGDCSTGASGAEVWTFTPQSSGKSGNGTWRKDDVSYAKEDRHAAAIGANFLNGGMTFSSLVNGGAKDTGAYFFGGMCPFQDSSDDWQSAANYSNLMVTLQPSVEGISSVHYQIGVSSSRGPPIAEAGFTLTGLSPSFFNGTDGIQTQQQNFVLVGGHTSNAFINMSQVALFSLPEQGWTFLPVSQPNPQRTDLAIRTDIDEIEPRSGHTAVLTPDGQRIIVLGGWIGDVNTPANPQFAVLNIGKGFGGQGNWEWTVPTTSGSGLPSGSGIYGHGAVMLPGGVMMIMGGYSISPPSSRGRRATQPANTNSMFFNVTSNTWIPEYVPPPPSKPVLPALEHSGPLATPSQRAGLGAGLGIGAAAVLGLMVFYLWYTRRLKKQRDFREKQLRELAMGAHRYNIDCLTPGVDGRGGNMDAMDYFDDPNDSYFYPTSGGQQNQGWRRANGHDAERTGLLVEIPSPTRGLRRSLGGRGGPSMNGRGGPGIRSSGHIHPIDELEEDEHEHETATAKTPLAPTLDTSPEMTERPSTRGASILDTAPVLDPFTDNHRKSLVNSASASPVREKGENPSHDWAIVHPGRSSPSSSGQPDKSDRTESNLSERSMRSNLSSTSHSCSLQRSISVRSTVILNHASHTNPFATPEGSPTRDKAPRGGGGWHSPSLTDPRTRSLTSIRSSNGRPSTANGNGNADADSFTTARTSFIQLQAEGEALLGGNPERSVNGRPGTSSSNAYSYQPTDPSLSRAGTITTATSVADALNGNSVQQQQNRPRERERRKSWLGSVRRALSRSITTNPISESNRTRSLTHSTPQLELYTDNPSPSPSPTTSNSPKRKSMPVTRSVSDASFWASKRGKQDWLDDEVDGNDVWKRNSGDDWGAPEDVALKEKERKRREWRERGNLINLETEDLPPLSPIELGAREDRPITPPEEEDWDVEAAVERRVVQVMFTVPKSRLRVVNADVDGSSILSLPTSKDDDTPTSKRDKENRGAEGSGSPSRVRDLVGRFEHGAGNGEKSRGSGRYSPSPSPSIKSLKVRGRGSERSLRSRKNEKVGEAETSVGER